MKWQNLAVISALCIVCNLIALRAENLPYATKWYGITKHESLYTPTSFKSVTYYLQGDTVFNDTTYQALWRDKGEYVAGLRMSADSQQVYIRPTEKLMWDYWVPGDHMLYNFDVQVGDTVFAYDGSYAGIDDTGEDLSYKWNVQDVQTIDGRKHVLVQGGQTEHQVEWIEGIGTKYILFENVYEDILSTYSSFALCAADNEGDILYSFNTDDLGIRNNCPDWETLAIENITDECSSTKYILQNGQILILRGEKTYTLTGQAVE